MRVRYCLLFIFFLLFLLPAGLFAIHIESINAVGSITNLINAEEEGAPGPLMPGAGGGIQLNISSNFYAVPALSLQGTQYQLAEDGIKAVPTEVEYRDSVWVLFVLLDPAIGYKWQYNQKLSQGVSFSPVFLFRAPLLHYGAVTDDLAAITNYLYGDGRFFYPAFGTDLFWKSSENLSLVLHVKLLLPWFHLWDGENSGFVDQMMIQTALGLRFFL
jgi:hypothetical protein